MSIRQTAVTVAIAVLLFFALCFQPWTEAASAVEASFILTEQSLDDLRKEGIPNEILKKLESLKDKKFTSEDEFLAAVRQEIGNDQTVNYKKQIVQHAVGYPEEIKSISDMQKALEQLEQRVKELETEKTAREEATRAIIRDSLSKSGSKINEFVTLGGSLEVNGGWTENFTGQNEGILTLGTAKLEFDIEANSWTKGSLILEFDDGTNVTFPTTSGFQTGVDRITVDQAYITIGDPLRFPPFMTAGRIVPPFGISTGNPVTDTLTIEDPLTIEGFEMRKTAVGFGIGFPTPAVKPAAPPVTPPTVRPLVINPLISSISRALGYKFSPPSLSTPITPKPAPTRFNAGIYSYNGDTFKGRRKTGGYRPGNYIDATAGFHMRGSCGRPYDQLRGSVFCPWSVDFDVDYNSSVFESKFLVSEYQSFLGQIGFVKGMAASLKSTLGPVSLVGEWNGAIERAEFIDGLGKPVSIMPSAWQVSLGYQFDWNPWVEEIGAQGTYATIDYSESRDLAGVTQSVGGQTSKVGFLPRRRFIVGAGEWVLENLRFAIEYSHVWDYPKDKGRTGKTADGILAQLTLVW